MDRPTPRFGHEPIAMRCVSDEDALDRSGDFCWDRDADGVVTAIWLVHPSPRADGSFWWTPIHIPVRQGPNKSGQHWGWDGNVDAPTLTPSIHTHGHWHGWVRAGQLVEA